MNIALKNRGNTITRTYTLYKEDDDALNELCKKLNMKKSEILRQLIDEAYKTYIDNDKK